MNEFNFIISFIIGVIMCVVLSMRYTINFINKLENSHNCID